MRKNWPPLGSQSSTSKEDNPNKKLGLQRHHTAAAIFLWHVRRRAKSFTQISGLTWTGAHAYVRGAEKPEANLC